MFALEVFAYRALIREQEIPVIELLSPDATALGTYFPAMVRYGGRWVYLQFLAGGS